MLLLWVPLSIYLFYLPYVLLLKDEGKRWVFYALSAFTFIFFFIWMIADFADCNGFIRVDQLFKASKGAAGFFALVTSLTNLCIVVLTVINTVVFWKKA